MPSAEHQALKEMIRDMDMESKKIKWLTTF